VVGRAVLRHVHLVDAPAALDEVWPRVAALLARGWRPGRPPPPPSPEDVAAGERAGGAVGPERPSGPPPAAPSRAELLEALGAARPA
jgi:hypothetical protein